MVAAETSATMCAASERDSVPSVPPIAASKLGLGNDPSRLQPRDHWAGDVPVTMKTASCTFAEAQSATERATPHYRTAESRIVPIA